MNFSKLKNFILNIIFPIECVGCGKDNLHICDECLNNLQYNPNYFIEKSAFSNLDGAFVVFEYNNKLIKKLIKNFKYHLIKDIGNTLGSLAYSFLKEKQDKINLKNLLILSVPLHKKRENWRGFNQVEIISSVIARSISICPELGQRERSRRNKTISPLSTTNLIKTKNTQPQARLDKESRQKNIQDSFAWIGESLEGQKILLIDDVLTTGSTLDECARVLKDAGAKKVYAIVIAHG